MSLKLCLRRSWRSRAVLVSTVGLLALGALAIPMGDQNGKENLDLPYDALSREGEEEEAPEIVVFYGEAYEADAFFYCLDGSLSMSDGGWIALERELTRSIRELAEATQFGVVFFDEDVVAFPASGDPATATVQRKQEAIEKIATVQPGSWTCILDGLRETFKMANRSTRPRKAIVLQSDGKPACPETDFVTYRAQILREAQALNTQHIPIHTVGVGLDVDESFLKSISEASGGTFRRIAR